MPEDVEESIEDVQKTPSTEFQIIDEKIHDSVILTELLSKLPEEQRVEIKRELVSFSMESSFSGPLPPPSILLHYDNIIPNGAERIIKMTEEQSKHRLQIEDHAVKEQLDQSKRGQNYGFIIGLAGLLAAVVLSVTGHDAVAGIIGGSTLLGMVTVFVVGKTMQKD